VNKYSWIFVDKDTQDTFRIHIESPSWHANPDGKVEQATCSFDVAANDGHDYQFELRISGGVLESEGVETGKQLIRFVHTKGMDIVESVLSQGFRGDQQILWETDGVSVVA